MQNNIVNCKKQNAPHETYHCQNMYGGNTSMLFLTCTCTIYDLFFQVIKIKHLHVSNTHKQVLALKTSFLCLNN